MSRKTSRGPGRPAAAAPASFATSQHHSLTEVEETAGGIPPATTPATSVTQHRTVVSQTTFPILVRLRPKQIRILPVALLFSKVVKSVARPTRALTVTVLVGTKIRYGESFMVRNYALCVCVKVTCPRIAHVETGVHAIVH